jgi:hypothetical protein
LSRYLGIERWWSEQIGPDGEIFLWDGSDITQITDNETDDVAPDISGSNVAWRCHDGNDWEICMTDVSTPTPTPTVTPTGTPSPTPTPTGTPTGTPAPTPTPTIQGEIKSKIQLKFSKPSKDKIQVKVSNWTLPAGVVPTDVTVNVGGAEFGGALDAKGKYKSPDKRDSIVMKQSKKTQFWKITVKRKNNNFAADLADEGLTNADNPKPGLQVTVPLTIEVGGATYSREMDLVYKSKLGKKGAAK